MAALFTKADLAGVTDMPVTEERYSAVHAAVLTAVRAEYPLAESATGRAADVVRSVALSAGLRLFSNPVGVRSGGLGNANATFGGTDESISAPADLTASERQRLARLRTGRRGVRSVDLLLAHETTEIAP
jgi:hypothetical protein